MGWFKLAKPGTEAGPCEAPCSHSDCAKTRIDSETPCEECGKPIGYDKAFYFLEVAKGPGPNIMVHTACFRD